MGRIDDALKRASARDIDSAWSTLPARAIVPRASEVTTFAPEGAEPVLPVAPLPEPERVAGSLIAESLQQKPTPGLTAFNPAFIERLVISPNPDRQLLEQFRALGAALHRAQTLTGTKTVMITSAEPNEGKTLTAVNLALILSESYGRRVLLIDADLRRPSIKEIAQISDLPGLNEALKSRQEQKLAVLRVTERLTLLPAGQPDPDPLKGLTSARMRHILAEAANGFDWVVLDAPPVGPIADASLLGSLVDTTLLVVRAGATAHSAVQRAVESIGRDRIFGVVLNGAEKVAEGSYGGYAGTNDAPVKH